MILGRLYCVILALLVVSAASEPSLAEIGPVEDRITPEVFWGPDQEILPQIQKNSDKKAIEKRIAARFARAIQHDLSPAKRYREVSVETTIGLVEAVHRYINEFSYIPDYETYGTEDHWATIDEFLEAGGGDSEDFAIAKYALLIRLGLDPSKLFIVARHHTAIESICHMYLVVEAHGRYFAFGHRSENATPVEDTFMSSILFVASQETVDVRNMPALQGVAFSW
jgi:predicted transglutaminase-like cysteine proteinase